MIWELREEKGGVVMSSHTFLLAWALTSARRMRSLNSTHITSDVALPFWSTSFRVDFNSMCLLASASTCSQCCECRRLVNIYIQIGPTHIHTCTHAHISVKRARLPVVCKIQGISVVMVASTTSPATPTAPMNICAGQWLTPAPL